MGGFLQVVLSTDLGYGHLETFARSSEYTTDFSLGLWPATVPVSLTFVPTSVREYPELLSGYSEKLQKYLLSYSSTQFRAPPALA